MLAPLIASVVEGFGEAYPELRENQAFVRQVRGLGGGAVLGHASPGHDPVRRRRRTAPPAGASRATTRSGSPTRRGSRCELIQRARRGGRLSVDVDGFRALLQEQRERARTAAKKVRGGPGRGRRAAHGVRGLRAPGGRRADRAAARRRPSRRSTSRRRATRSSVFLDRTPFYAEGGGQVGDRGTIRTPTGVVRVHDTQRVGDHAIVHVGVGRLRRGPAGPGRARAEIDRARARGDGARAHVHPRRALDAEAPAGRAREASGVARGAGPAPVRLPASVGGPARGARGGGARGEPPPRARRRRPDLRDDDGGGAVARGGRAVRGEVRRHGPRRGDRRLLARAVRRHARARAPGTWR